MERSPPPSPLQGVRIPAIKHWIRDNIRNNSKVRTLMKSREPPRNLPQYNHRETWDIDAAEKHENMTSMNTNMPRRFKGLKSQFDVKYILNRTSAWIKSGFVGTIRPINYRAIVWVPQCHQDIYCEWAILMNRYCVNDETLKKYILEPNLRRILLLKFYFEKWGQMPKFHIFTWIWWN